MTLTSHLRARAPPLARRSDRGAAPDRARSAPGRPGRAPRRRSARAASAARHHKQLGCALGCGSRVGARGPAPGVRLYQDVLRLHVRVDQAQRVQEGQAAEHLRGAGLGFSGSGPASAGRPGC